MMNEGKKTIYYPRISVLHLEDASTNFIVKGRKKRRFILKNHLSSMKAILDELNNNK